MKNMKTANQEYRKECMDSFSKEFWKSEAIRLQKEAKTTKQAVREFADEAGECDADNAWKRLPNGNAKIRHLVEWSMLRKRWGI